MKRTALLFAALVAALGAVAGPAAAQVRGGVAVTVGGGWHGHSGWHGGGWRPRVGIGIGFSAPLYYGPYYEGPYYAPYPYYGGTLLVAPPLAYGEAAPVLAAPPMTQPDPVFYPRNGQSAAQTEIDRRECNRWAIGQQNAMADATVFHRATLACMEGRGYTVR
jgi:hypothetical protein